MATYNYENYTSSPQAANSVPVSRNAYLEREGPSQWIETTFGLDMRGVSSSREGGSLARIESMTESGPFKMVNDFYEANASVISSKARSFADSDGDGKNDNDFNGSSEASKVLMKGLTALTQLHPFVAVAVGAFALVVTLDLTRRDNDRKVLAVKAQMHDLMTIFFELRRIKDPEDRGVDGTTISDRLEGMMISIGNDIKACGSACDTYLKKGFLAKTVKSGKYETRLAEFANLFADYRQKIELSLHIHTALGVDSANFKLDAQEARLKGIEEKLDMMSLFRKLDTPREKDIQKFIDEHGGVKACIDNDELLEELIAKSGESLSRISGKESSGRRSNDLPDIRKKLRKELQEDLDDALKRNMVLFERKLDIQSKQLTETIQEESDHIISTLLSGAHDRIIDPDLQTIWKDMGWKGSVKARHFVLALHDYYTDRLSSTNRMSTSDRLSSIITDSPPGLPSPMGSPKPKSRSSNPLRRQDDRWALAYINAAYVQPILEAVDDDGTGFVSVKEVNTFVSSRPVGWSLPHWIAYWAVGWQASISRYKTKIYQLIHNMFQTLNHVLPSNRRAVDEYLFHPSFWRIELLLRSTRDVNPKIMSDPDLARIVDAYTSMEEEMIDSNLSNVAYELDEPATVSLITGAGRIERYALPLIYLLLRRHLKVMTIACKHVVDTEEFVTLNESLVSILLSIDHRIQILEAIFKQTHPDVQARLGNFAFGMFQLSYGDIRRIPIQNSFGTHVDESVQGTEAIEDFTQEGLKASVAHIPLTILKHGIKDGYQVTDYFEWEPGREPRKPSPFYGTWTGICSRFDGEQTISFMVRISIKVSTDGRRIIGKGEDFTGAFEFSGRTSGSEFKFTVTSDEDGAARSCSGRLDNENGVMTAHWSTSRKRDSGSEAVLPFKLTRTPPSLVRYRYNAQEFSEDPVRSRWSFACSAALHQARERLWSRCFFETQFAERKQFVELTTRDLIVSMGLTPQNPLSITEKAELEYLRRDINPSEARFYQALAEFEIQKLPWHPAWGCDWCERRITRCRILCTQCIAEDLSDNIDLCAVCIDKAPTKRGFTHDISHTVVKVEQTLHDYHFPRVVESAKAASERIKNIFRTLEPMVVRNVDEDRGAIASSEEANLAQSTVAADLSCACCRKRVTPPCWVCVTCTRDTLVCIDCDKKRLPALADGPSPMHLLTHALVRVRDTARVGETISAEDRIIALEQRVLSLEYKLTEGFTALEAKVDDRLAGLESRVDERLAKMEAEMGERFSTLEMVLRQIAAQTAALPAIYGQVVRDYARSSSIRDA